MSIIARWQFFKQNCKTFQIDVTRLQDHASGVLDSWAINPPSRKQSQFGQILPNPGCVGCAAYLVDSIPLLIP